MQVGSTGKKKTTPLSRNRGVWLGFVSLIDKLLKNQLCFKMKIAFGSK